MHIRIKYSFSYCILGIVPAVFSVYAFDLRSCLIIEIYKINQLFHLRKKRSRQFFSIFKYKLIHSLKHSSLGLMHTLIRKK